MLAVLAASLLTGGRVVLALGGPQQVEVLGPAEQRVVDWAAVQLAGGEVGDCRLPVRAENFSRQLVAGTRVSSEHYTPGQWSIGPTMRSCAAL